MLYRLTTDGQEETEFEAADVAEAEKKALAILDDQDEAGWAELTHVVKRFKSKRVWVEEVAVVDAPEAEAEGSSGQPT